MQVTRDHTASDGLIQALMFNLVLTLADKYWKMHCESPQAPQDVSGFLTEVDTKRVLTALRKLEAFSVTPMREYTMAGINRYELKAFSHTKVGR